MLRWGPDSTYRIAGGILLLCGDDGAAAGCGIDGALAPDDSLTLGCAAARLASDLGDLVPVGVRRHLDESGSGVVERR